MEVKYLRFKPTLWLGHDSMQVIRRRLLKIVNSKFCAVSRDYRLLNHTSTKISKERCITCRLVFPTSHSSAVSYTDSVCNEQQNAEAAVAVAAVGFPISVATPSDVALLASPARCGQRSNVFTERRINFFSRERT